MKRWLLPLLVLLIAPDVYASEADVIAGVAREYGLDRWQTRLMFAIRKAENGPPGFEFGVIAAKGTDLKTQARWTAGSIKKRCNGPAGLERFAARWAPVGAENDPDGLNENWLPNVRAILKGERR